jgi:DNA-binding MarR family transcriptional regulator
VTTTDGEQIAAVLKKAAVLLVRHLNYGQGQSLTSSTVLALLDDEGPVRISALTAASGVSQPAMTELVARLQREGLVTRLSDPQDARATLVDITARGRARRVKLQKSVHDRLVALLDMLPAESRATLSLAMRVAAPLIDQLTQLASKHPDS